MSWSFFAHEALGTTIIGVLAISVLVLAEVLKRTTDLPTELTRKFAHIGSGFAVLLIPALIDSSWTVLLLAAAFAGILFGTNLLGMLQGVHGVGRGIGGVLWYPVTAWLTYFIVFDMRHGLYLEYAIPVLVLACADAMGAVVGKRFGRHRYEVIPGHFRSLEGSAAFYVVAFACIFIPLTAGLGADPLHAAFVTMLVAALATAYESVSVHGLDNLLVPFGTLLFLDRYIGMDAVALALQSGLLVVIFALATVIRWRRPATGGGIASFVLAIYTVLVLGGWGWAPPLAGLLVAFVAYERLTPVPERMTKSRYEMGTALIGLTVPVVLVLLYAAAIDGTIRHMVYVAYLTSIAGQGAVLFFMMPQHRTFRFPRVRRVVTARDPWQYRVTAGKVLFAAAGAALTLVLPLAAAGRLDAARSIDVAMAMGLCGIGVTAFVLLASLACAKRACGACGNVSIHGIGCCHDLDLGIGSLAGFRTMTFRKTYLLSNTIAAAAAAGVVAWTGL